MKKIFFKGAALALFAMFSTNVMAQSISITDASVEAGGTGEAIVSVTGDNVKGCQLYLSGDGIDGESLVPSLEAIEDAYESSADLSLSKFNTKKSRYTILVSDKEGGVLTAGEFLKIIFTAKEGLAEGDYNLNLNVAEINLTEGDPIEQGDVAFKVTVGPTGIEAIEVINNAPVYNLNGMLMNGNLQKGVYVQNGKKFIVK